MPERIDCDVLVAGAVASGFAAALYAMGNDQASVMGGTYPGAEH